MQFPPPTLVSKPDREYCPTCIVALGTMKADLVCGLDGEPTDRLNTEAANWLVNGQSSMVQFALPNFV